MSGRRTPITILGLLLSSIAIAGPALAGPDAVCIRPPDVSADYCKEQARPPSGPLCDTFGCQQTAFVCQTVWVHASVTVGNTSVSTPYVVCVDLWTPKPPTPPTVPTPPPLPELPQVEIERPELGIRPLP